MVYTVMILVMMINIIILIYACHTRKSEKNKDVLRLRELQQQAKDIGQLKLDLSALKLAKTAFDHDLNGWVNGEKTNHREIIKLNELHKNISARLNHLTTAYQELDKEVNILKK